MSITVITKKSPSGKPIEFENFVKVDTDKNNNKYWRYYLYDSGDLLVQWGRVGAAKGQEKLHVGAGTKKRDSLVKQKTGPKKGYTKTALMGSSESSTSKRGGGAIQRSKLAAIAKQQIADKPGGCPRTAKLVEYLVQTNAHDITNASGGKITVNAAGQAQVNIGGGLSGVIEGPAIAEARKQLIVIGRHSAKNSFSAPAFKKAVSAYMQLIPQKTGSRKGWERTFFGSSTRLQEQNALLDALDATVQHVISNSGSQDIPDEKVFNVTLTLADAAETKRIKALYNKTRRRMHSSYGLGVKTVYRVQIEVMDRAFDADGAKIACVASSGEPSLGAHPWELWHGTKTANLLSILRGGLRVPPASAAHVTGRMFGDGVYFSDQSTKSLNYSQGYWGGATDNNPYMLLAQVAMGRFHTPSGAWGYRQRSLPRGYDSTYARANRSGVMNNEMIVYRIGQCKLTHLVEFSPGGR